jgi:hypothetical protein
LRTPRTGWLVFHSSGVTSSPATFLANKLQGLGTGPLQCKASTPGTDLQKLTHTSEEFPNLKSMTAF